MISIRGKYNWILLFIKIQCLTFGRYLSSDVFVIADIVSQGGTAAYGRDAENRIFQD